VKLIVEKFWIQFCPRFCVLCFAKVFCLLSGSHPGTHGIREEMVKLKGYFTQK